MAFQVRFPYSCADIEVSYSLVTPYGESKANRALLSRAEEPHIYRKEPYSSIITYHIHSHVHIHTRKHPRMHNTHIYIHTYTHTHTHTITHTHTYLSIYHPISHILVMWDMIHSIRFGALIPFSSSDI